MELVLAARSVDLVKALATNSDASTFTEFVPQATAPTGEGVFKVGEGSVEIPDRVIVMPYCSGGALQSFSMRLFAWRAIKAPAGITKDLIWIPHLLVELACVSCNKAGPALAGSPLARNVSEAEFFCDTITLANGLVGPNGGINSPGGNLIATAKIDLCGCKFLQFDFQKTDPVSMNCLWSVA